MNPSRHQPRKSPGAPPLARPHARRSGILLAAIYVAGLLYCYSPLPAVDTFDRHDEPLARVRMLGALAQDMATEPLATWVYWEGPEGTSWLIDRLAVAALAGGVLAVATAAGACVLVIGMRMSGLTVNGGTMQISRVEAASFSVGLGLSATSLFVRTLGFFSLSRGQFLACCAIAAALVVAILARYVQQRKRSLRVVGKRAVDSTSNNQTSPKWLWLATPPAVVVLLGGLLPPLDFDVLEYHVQAPKEFFQLGRVVFLPHNVYANMPLGSEMFALLGMHVMGDWWTGAVVGKTIMAAFALAAALAVWSFGWRLGGSKVGVLAAVLYLATPWTIRIANLGLNENALALYAVLTAHAAYLWSLSRRSGCLWMAGFFAGSAASIKYTGLLFVAAPLCAVVMYVTFRHCEIDVARRRRMLSSLGAVALAIAAGCWPWYAANWWNTGNPVYPLLADWLGPPAREGLLAAQWSAAHAPAGFSFGDLASDVADFAWRSEWHNPLLLALAAAALIGGRGKWKWWAAGYLAFYFAAWWLLTHRLDRFWVPAIPAMALLAGGAATLDLGRISRRVLQASLVVWLVVCLAWAVHPASLCGYVRFLASYNWLRNDPARNPPWRQSVNEFAGPSDAVLAVGDAAVFDLHANVYYNTVFDPWLLGEWLGDADDFRERARSLHGELLARDIGHVYVHWDELNRYRSTYDRDFHRSDFITRELFQQLTGHSVLTPLAARLAGANVSLFSVNRANGDEANANP